MPKDKIEIDKMIKLRDVKTKEKFELSEEGIIITDKLAELINAKVGDTIKVTTSDDVEKEIKVVGITENYISHYVYMSKELYQQIYGDEYHTNALMIQDNDLTEEQEEKFMQEAVARNEVSTVTLTKTTMKTLDDTMNSLNYVVVILIVSAGLLAFVVLYNLSNINISERIRELATIKVLGFYDREVYDYVTRETIILTLIGILLGLGVGYFLNFYILGTCEINMLRFEKIVHPPRSGFFLPRIENHKSAVKFFSGQICHLFLESLPVPLIILVWFSRPVPPVEVPRMVDAPAVFLHKKCDSLIGGEQRLHMGSVHIQAFMGRHEMYIFRFRPAPGTVLYIGRQNVLHFFTFIFQLKYRVGKMVSVCVRGKYIQFLFIFHERDFSFPVVKQHIAALRLHQETAVV